MRENTNFNGNKVIKFEGKNSESFENSHKIIRKKSEFLEHLLKNVFKKHLNLSRTKDKILKMSKFYENKVKIVKKSQNAGRR